MNIVRSWGNENHQVSGGFPPIAPESPPWPTKVATGGTAAGENVPKAVRPVGSLRAILFEPDNVLYDATFWQRWMWHLLSRLGVQRDFPSFCDIWQRGYLVDAQRGSRDFCAILHAFLVDWGLTAGQIDEVEAASAAKRRELHETMRPLPGVANILARLCEEGFVLAILANSEMRGDELGQRIERLGLGGKFRFVFTSRDLGHVKPEPACYQAAMDALRLAPSQAALVGSAADDLHGAASIGLQTIAVNCDTYPHATHCVRRFDEFLAACLPAPGTAAG